MENIEKQKFLNFLNEVYFFVDFTDLEKDTITSYYNNIGRFNYHLLVKKIKEIIKGKLYTPEKLIDFININFSEDKNMSEHEFFSFLESFLDKIGIYPSFDVWQVILKNNCVINNHVEKFVDRNLNYIRSGYISKFFDNPNIILLIKAYAKLNDISIENDKNLTSLNNNIDDYFKELAKLPVLSKEEENELFNRLSLGDETAREKLILSNLRLVVYIAKHYRNCGIPFQDLIEEGNYGLMIAVERFDMSMGYRFSTYAYWWIRQGIKRYIEQHTRLIRVPSYLNKKLFNYLDAYNALAIELGRTPSRDEISEKLGVSYDVIVDFEKILNQIHSMDYVYNEFDTDISQYVTDDFDLEEQASMDLLSGDIEKLFKDAKLTLKEITILKMHFGFLGKVMTYEEIGKKIGVTKQRVQQIEKNIFRKIRRAKSIGDYAKYTDCDINSLYFVDYSKTRNNGR